MKKKLTEKLTNYAALAILTAPLAFCAPQSAAADPFQLGVEQRGQGQTYAPASAGGYYTPTALPATMQPMEQRPPMQGNANSGRMQGNAQQNRPPQQRPPMQASVQSVALPPAFMGSWLVIGQRSAVEAKTPEFQQQAAGAFSNSTRNIWNISGSPQQGYAMSNDMGVQTSLKIMKVQGQQAVIFYQHPMGKSGTVMAQEQIIMELQNGGARFSGFEKIAINKQGEGVRATVKYSLSGQRQ
ncbi:hypothetical protein BH11CYA1_BH11CYA1_19330 [soil metagenome]